MDIGVIKSAQNNGTWESANGTMYVQEIELEDGRVGSVNAKKPGRWQAGDKVEVKEATPSKYGTRFKLGLALNVSARDVEKGTTSRAASWKFPDDRQNQINASWAIGQAISMGYNDGEAILDHARKLLSYRETLIKELEGKDQAKLAKESVTAPKPAEVPEAWVDKNNEEPPF